MLQAEVVHIIDGYKQPINLLDIRSLEELTIHWNCCNTNETFYYNVFNIQLNPAPQRKGHFSLQVKLGMQKANFWLLTPNFWLLFVALYHQLKLLFEQKPPSFSPLLLLTSGMISIFS